MICLQELCGNRTQILPFRVSCLIFPYLNVVEIVNYVEIFNLLWHWSVGDCDWRQTCPSCCTCLMEVIHTAVYQWCHEMQPGWRRSMKVCWHKQVHTQRHREHNLNQCQWCLGRKICELWTWHKPVLYCGWEFFHAHRRLLFMEFGGRKKKNQYLDN